MNTLTYVSKLANDKVQVNRWLNADTVTVNDILLVAKNFFETRPDMVTPELATKLVDVPLVPMAQFTSEQLNVWRVLYFRYEKNPYVIFRD